MEFTFKVWKGELAIEIKLMKCYSANTSKHVRKIQHRNHPPSRVFFKIKQEFVPYLQYP